MNNINDFAYWMAISHLKNWRKERVNSFLYNQLFSNNLTLIDFFEMELNDWILEFEFSDNELNDLTTARETLPNLSFQAENLLSQGFQIIPINSPNYPSLLLANLTLTHAPSLIYLKGNQNLLQEPTTAIVGSRKASEEALQFTKSIAKLETQQNRIIVSGFAKGVDRTALDAALVVNGKSIIVLPQGILTFSNGYKYYYEQITHGDVLVLSTFPPEAPWSIGYAMARNPIIYGLAEKIFVAESSESGGTWSGVIDGLKKGRTIFVRKPRTNENNANDLLIVMGSKPVDKFGKIDSAPKLEQFQSRITDLLRDKQLTLEEIKTEFNNDINLDKLEQYLSKIKCIYKNTGQKYSIKNNNVVQGQFPKF